MVILVISCVRDESFSSSGHYQSYVVQHLSCSEVCSL